MLVMRTTERPADPVGELVGSQQAVEFDDPSFPMNPLGLDGVQPRALLGKMATHHPHPLAAVFDAAVVPAEPSPDLFGDVPGSVVPDEEQNLLARRFELLATPRKEPRRYTAHGSAVDEPYPSIAEPWQVESVTGDGFGIGVVLGDRPLDEAIGLLLLGEGAEGGQGHPAPPAFVLEADGPATWVGIGYRHQSVAPPFFLSYRGSGEVIHRLARRQRTPRRRAKVARMVSPETRLGVSPSSKATSAAIESVHKLLSWPNSLGERCSSPLKASALSSSKASRVRFGREDLATRASTPLASKSWMASRTVCCPQPRFSAIRGTSLPFEQARSISERRRVKASLERSPAWRVSCSFSESERTKMGVFKIGRASCRE